MRRPVVDRVLWCVLDVGTLKVHVWLVDPERYRDQLREDDTPAVGVFLPDSLEILLDWTLARENAEQTLMHECAHAEEFVFGHSHDHDTLNAITACQYVTYKRNGFLRFPPRPATPFDRKRARAARQARPA